jgi:hypothetical protein
MTNVHDEERSGCPSLVINDQKENFNAKNSDKNRRTTVPPPEEILSRLESEE